MRQIVEILRQTYSARIGVEFMHIQDPDQKSWIQVQMEGSHNLLRPSAEAKREILDQLTAAEGFERFLHVKFPGTKRFGLDGGESTVPVLEAIVRRSAELGVDEVVIGMSHRGRLNVLANVMGKPYTAIFSEFQGGSAPDDVLGSGDVKYHLGTSTDRELPDGRKIHLSLTANPSHLEAVNPVVLGKVRAKQRQKGDTERSRVMGLLLHGDAAFAGQGVVQEGLEMSELRGFRTGGTIHVIVNNQIGFTTSPAYARSSPYPSDVARTVQSPIFHVNGDDPEAVVLVGRMAAEFRQRFKKDVVIDLWCYRRHGHNEADEPSFTQPLMYRTIAQHPTTRQIYTRRLSEEGVLGEGEGQRIYDAFQERLADAHEASAGYKTNKADWLEGAWSRPEPGAGRRMSAARTAVALETLREIGLAMTEIPQGLHVHRKLSRIIGQRRQAIESGEGIDWATAEHLAFGTLLREGVPVRLSGEDVGRGTFSQRHAVLYDQETEERYVPLEHLHEGQPTFEVVDSPLSEEGVLGFEYGYSLADPTLPGAVGGAVRRLRQRRAGLFRPVHLRRRGEVAAHVGPGLPAAARLRGPGARAQLGAARALPAALRRRQPPGAVSVDAGVVLPRAAPADAPRLPQAADRDDAEVAAAPQGVHLDPRRHGAGQQLPSRHVREAALARRREGRPRRAVLGQGLLRSGAAPRRARARRTRRPVAPGADRAVPARGAGRGAGALREVGRGRSGARRSPGTWAPGASSRRASRRCSGSSAWPRRAPSMPAGAAAAATATGSHQQHLREQSSLVDLALQGDQGQGKQAQEKPALTAGAA